MTIQGQSANYVATQRLTLMLSSFGSYVAYRCPRKFGTGVVGVNGTSGALIFVVTWPLFRGPAVSWASVAGANLWAKNEKTTVLGIFISVFVEITRKVSFTITTRFWTLQSSYYERLKLVITYPSDWRGWHIVQADNFLGNQAGTRR